MSTVKMATDLVDLVEARGQAIKHWRELFVVEKQRAAQAERERDAWKASAIEEFENLKRAVKERDEARGAQPRPLTADDITDEMVRRGSDWAMDNPMFGDEDMRELLTAALTEPPARPTGAEELADEMEDYSHNGLLEENGLAGLADHLAAMGYRKTEDQS